MRHQATFRATMQRLLSYMQSYEEDYGVRFINVCVMNPRKGMRISNFLSASPRPTNIRSITVGKMMITYRGVVAIF